MLVAHRIKPMISTNIIARDVINNEHVAYSYIFYKSEEHRFNTFYNYIIDNFKKDHHFYNVYVRNKMKCKFYIDFDLVTDIKDHKAQISKVVEELKAYVNKILGEEQTFHISATIYDDKLSIHLITDKVFDDNKEIYKLLVNAPKGVDKKVYKSVQLMRTVFSSKLNKGKRLWPLEYIMSSASLDEQYLVDNCNYTDEQIYEFLSNDCITLVEP